MKKWICIFAVLYGTYWYASNHFNFSDTLVYAKKNPSASWAPAVDYYVGLVYLQRDEYGKSQEAFTQLLTDYSTGPYTSRGLMRLSQVAIHNRDWPVARQSLERFIQEFPDHPERPIADQRWDFVKFK